MAHQTPYTTQLPYYLGEVDEGRIGGNEGVLERDVYRDDEGQHQIWRTPQNGGQVGGLGWQCAVFRIQRKNTRAVCQASEVAH